VGTSPGINPITPYSSAALDYRASWIAGDMATKSKEFGSSATIRNRLWDETMRNEEKSYANSVARPAKMKELPPPHRGPAYLESNGLQRSLATNIPDHPTAIQVNGLRQERTADVICKGYVHGVNTYDSRTLCGNWSEERCDKSHVPSAWKAPTGRDWQWRTTYGEMTQHLDEKVLPVKGSNAETLYTHPASRFATGVKEESSSSNSEIIKLGGLPGVDYQPGDERSASRHPGNYVNYQCGKQHLVAVVAGKTAHLTPYETTTQAAFRQALSGVSPSSTQRCDVDKPPFQIRDPGRDGKSKMLCGIRDDEYGCTRDDPDYLDGHVLGNPVPNKQTVYTVGEYRRKWTKTDPAIIEAGLQDTSEYRASYKAPDHKKLDATRMLPGHVGTWH